MWQYWWVQVLLWYPKCLFELIYSNLRLRASRKDLIANYRSSEIKGKQSDLPECVLRDNWSSWSYGYFSRHRPSAWFRPLTVVSHPHLWTHFRLRLNLCCRKCLECWCLFKLCSPHSFFYRSSALEPWSAIALSPGLMRSEGCRSHCKGRAIRLICNQILTKFLYRHTHLLCHFKTYSVRK